MTRSAAAVLRIGRLLVSTIESRASLAPTRSKCKMSAVPLDTRRLVIPMLVCRDAAAEIEFCTAAFAAEELSRRTAPDGSVVHATLSIGGAMVMVHGEYPHLASRAPETDGSSSVVIYV